MAIIGEWLTFSISDHDNLNKLPKSSATVMLILKVPLSPETLRARLLVWANTSSRYPFFKGNSKDLASWFEIVERACEENEIPDIQYAEAAIVFIQGDLCHVMEERRVRYLENSGDAYWVWADFKDDIKRIIVEAEKSASQSAPRVLLATGHVTNV